jgi:clan AA aspartic protease
VGLIHASLALSNPRRHELAPLQVTALVDTGAITLCIPEHVAVQLDLSELEKREVTTAEGRHVAVPYVGPVQITFANRSCFTGAFVLGDGVLLGSIPMEDMDLVIDSRRQEISVNPESPNMPSAVVKALGRQADGARTSKGQPRTVVHPVNLER